MLPSILDSLLSAAQKSRWSFLFFGYLLLALTPMYAATGGSIPGTVADQSGAVIPSAALELVNIAQQTKYHAKSDGAGLFTFPNLPLVHDDLTVTANGFTSRKKTGLTSDTASARKIDFMMQVARRPYLRFEIQQIVICEVFRIEHEANIDSPEVLQQLHSFWLSVPMRHGLFSTSHARALTSRSFSASVRTDARK